MTSLPACPSNRPVLERAAATTATMRTAAMAPRPAPWLCAALVLLTATPAIGVSIGPRSGEALTKVRRRPNALRCGAACAAGAPRRAVRGEARCSGALDGCVRVCALLSVTARSSIHMHWPCVRVGCAPARPAGILQPIPPTEVLAEAAGASTAPEAADPNQVGPRPCCQPTKSRVARQMQTQRTTHTHTHTRTQRA